MNIQRQIQLLDCTLRDGGHLNEGRFGREVIKNVICKLVEAKTDIIEVGFLWDKAYGEDVARYYTIEDVKRILPLDKGESKFSLMADFIDLEHLEPYDGTIEFIRLSFKRHRIEWGLKTARILMEKGYKVFINPVNCNVYTDEQYIDVLKEINQLNPYGFSIVDTFGVMRLRDLTYRYGLVENNLNPNITIGLHLHENLGLAYSLAQHFVQMVSPHRSIVIDGSLLGMGRVPGNLCMEQFMDHLNYEYGCNYNVEPIFDAIDDYIAPIKKKTPWGYAIPYALSAKYHLHRTYAEFLMNKWKLRTSDIERILSMIPNEEAELFNESYAERLYRDYMSVEIDDSNAVWRFRQELNGKKVFIIAPGVTINEKKEKLKEFINKEHPIVICVHCMPDFVSPDFVFFTNIKRYDIFRSEKTDIRKIVSSNLTRDCQIDENAFVFNYLSMVSNDNDFCDDSVMMVMNLLKRENIHEIYVAGFDGIKDGKGDFYISILSRDNVDKEYSDNVKNILKKHYQDVKIHFLTESYYSDYKE